MLHQVDDLFKLNLKLRGQKVNRFTANDKLVVPHPLVYQSPVINFEKKFKDLHRINMMKFRPETIPVYTKDDNII